MKPNLPKTDVKYHAYTKQFSDLPPGKRDAIRQVVKDYAGDCISYEGGFLTVALPADKDQKWLLIQTMPHYGMKLIDMAYFPLCTDKPAEHLRHRCPTYQKPNDRPAYWLYAHFAYVL